MTQYGLNVLSCVCVRECSCVLVCHCTALHRHPTIELYYEAIRIKTHHTMVQVVYMNSMLPEISINKSRKSTHTHPYTESQKDIQAKHPIYRSVQPRACVFWFRFVFEEDERDESIHPTFCVNQNHSLTNTTGSNEQLKTPIDDEETSHLYFHDHSLSHGYN